MNPKNKEEKKMVRAIRFLIIIGVAAVLFAGSTAAQKDTDKKEENKIKDREETHDNQGGGNRIHQKRIQY